MALKVMMKKWNKNEVDYLYVDDQLRAIRQDLRVQRIFNEFTVQVSHLSLNAYRYMRLMREFLWSMQILTTSINVKLNFTIFIVKVSKATKT